MNSPKATDSKTVLSPEEAGRKAREMASALSMAPPPSSNSHRDSMTTLPPLATMETLLAHAGVDPTIPNAPMSPPLHLATTYTRPEDGNYALDDSVYSRAGNPTRDLLEREMARLECHGKALPDDRSSATCCAFASGMMAVSSIILSHAAPVHLILPKDLYHGVLTVSVDVFSRFFVSTQQVDLTDMVAVQTALTQLPENTDIILWMESPSNPFTLVTDIEEVCRIAQLSNRTVTTVVDSTLAPPVITQPLLLGADLVMHSATKYLAGHSDALIGVVTASPWTERGRLLAHRLKQTQMSVGGVASILDSWLTLRGMRTLALRVQRQSQTALQVAQFLENHYAVQKVHYPGLAAHRQHAIAERQMNGMYGGLLSIEMTTEARAMAFAGALQTIQRATSLGGTETLIEHRASIEPMNRKISPPGLLRISIGLEHPQDLINDITCALKIVDKVSPYRASPSPRERSDWRRLLSLEDENCFIGDLEE